MFLPRLCSAPLIDVSAPRFIVETLLAAFLLFDAFAPASNHMRRRAARDGTNVAITHTHGRVIDAPWAANGEAVSRPLACGLSHKRISDAM
ncbi:hypothetical protein CIW54_26420 [Paraburkholderia sp. T12-10]|nr:hypothetical protein CIW54_26420 [Paraburkholderia sp. T12-10]